MTKYVLTETDHLREFVVEEQSELWNELCERIREAVDGVWSIRAAQVARRIVEAARLTGPTPHMAVQWTLVAGGVYEAVLTAGGLPVEQPEDEDEWQRLDELMAAHGSTRATCRPALAATVAKIRTPRETHWIAGGNE